MKHIKLFEGFINEEATPEWKAVIDFVKKNNSWFDIEEEDDEEILLTTRENGNVGSETPGQKDKAEARRIFKLVSDKFPKQVTGNLEEVDEFVYLYIKKAQSNLNKNEGREVMVADMDVEAAGLVDEIKDSLDFASAKLYDFKKMSDYIKNDYPELSKDIVDIVEPMMTELEKEYPKKLQELLKKFK